VIATTNERLQKSFRRLLGRPFTPLGGCKCGLCLATVRGELDQELAK
jgi:hypothetical protein